MYANFEETRSRDPDLGTLNLRKKNAIFVPKIYIRLYLWICLTWNVEIWSQTGDR